MAAIEQVKPEEIPESLRVAIEAAKAQHPNLYVLHAEVDGVDVTVACKRPPRAIYRKFREDAEGGVVKAAHRYEELFMACLVIPSPKDFDAILETMPALADSFGVQLWDKVVGAEVASIKKA